jgi:hypothetical protein
VDDWGPSESTEEWLLMFERGVTPEGIADLCRVDVRRVRRAVQKEIRRDPRFLDRCLILHDQPTFRPSPIPAAPTAAEKWAQNYVVTAGYVLKTGSLPSQNAGLKARAMYKWLQYQRLLNDAGKLEEKRREALDKLGAWQGVHRGHPDEHWGRRLQEVIVFREKHGRFPYYSDAGDQAERQLAVWLGRQRTWSRRGKLRLDREHRLHESLKGWQLSGR